MNAFTASLKENPELLAAVARFNAPGLDDFDPQALPGLPAALLRDGTLKKLGAGRGGGAMIRAWLFRQLGAKEAFTDFGEERRRLALLEKETLNSLALVYGACIHAREAACLIKREEVAALRGLLGAHYEYALSRGRLQTRQAGDYFASFRPGEPLAQRMAEAGFAALRRCLADWPEDLFRLAAPRLPAALRLPADGKSAPLLPVFWADLKKLLLTQVAPQWQTCFA
ncbi:MAG: SctK family type III secretion system sorting platform protein [Deltaproteobacteria bacterium]|nr:SctK family type III secretion system sorting platform protein [Deltaproteobacteria bacterium]